MQMKKIVLLKYGELVLKGLNRSYFDNLLLRRVRVLLKAMGGTYETDYAQSTLCIRGGEDADMDAVAARMKKVFGVASVCVGYECEKDMEAIRRTIAAHASELLRGASRFKCVAKRSDKRFPLGSPEICAECGALLLSLLPGLTVDVTEPEVCVTIEIRDRAAFVHGGGEKGAGGMPVGSNGRALLLLSGGIDSPVAGYMIAKRGVELDGLYFESPPYTGEQAKEKVVALAQTLADYTGRMYLNTISVTEIQETLMQKCDEKLFTLLLRRFMMRLAERTAQTIGAGALVTGESVGQVASQTLDNIRATNDAVSLPVFRPLIGSDKLEIIAQSQQLGTFPISSQDAPDCCTLFMPRNPETHANLTAVREAEAAFPIDQWVEELACAAEPHDYACPAYKPRKKSLHDLMTENDGD